MDLNTPIQEAGRLLKLRAKLLSKLGIQTIEDMLYYIPFRYDDFSLVSKIGNVQEGEVVTIQGEVVEFNNIYTRSRMRIQKSVISDDTGSLEVAWFNQPYLSNIMRAGDSVSVAGKIAWRMGKPTLISPEYELLKNGQSTIHTSRLVPVYSETRGISSKWIRTHMYQLLQIARIEDFLPENVKLSHNLLDLIDALKNCHFPNSLDGARQGRVRLSFDELFLIQLSAFKRKKEWELKKKGIPLHISPHKKQIESFWKKLPFDLTGAQKNAVKDIFSDIALSKPMNRLLQGEVGSGKTVVATIAMYVTCLNGYQSVLMAPTEILAQQHYKTISSLLSPLGVKVNLATGSIKYKVSGIKGTKKRNMPNTKYSIFDTSVLVGTHAVLSRTISFKKLGLVVIDEQQRFGVEQRSIIRQKGEDPHFLTMTATPIPRTIALTLYGDLNLSVLDEMPKKRKIVKTWLVPPEKRKNAYEWIRKQINETQSQVFIICPFIEESESLSTVKAATKEFGFLQKEIFPDLKLGLLHGKLKAKEKDTTLTAFRNRAFDILVATPVVEVGIDIPNATVIVVEAADRFGLAQLHQIRGRVGRGEKQSYCLLFSDSKSEQTTKRLKALEEMHSGAQLAQLDLQLRGPGEVYGTTQHGKNILKIASFSDFPLIEKTRKEAEKIFPKLSEYPLLEERLKTTSIENVSPD